MDNNGKDKIVLDRKTKRALKKVIKDLKKNVNKYKKEER